MLRLAQLVVRHERVECICMSWKATQTWYRVSDLVAVWWLIFKHSSRGLCLNTWYRVSDMVQSLLVGRVLLVLSGKPRVLFRMKGIHSVLRFVMFGIIPKADRLHCLYSLPEWDSNIIKIPQSKWEDLDFHTAF